MTVKFDYDNLETVSRITDRAMALAAKHNIDYDPLICMMDLVACSGNGNPMDFDRLLTADEFDFAHDVFGIRRHIDRETGKLTGCFSPRFSIRC